MNAEKLRGLKELALEECIRLQGKSNAREAEQYAIWTMFTLLLDHLIEKAETPLDRIVARAREEAAPRPIRGEG